MPTGIVATANPIVGICQLTSPPSELPPVIGSSVREADIAR